LLELKRLRPLVEEERRRTESARATIESKETRKRLDALEKAAVRFMEEYGEEDEPYRDPGAQVKGSKFREKGFQLSPPFAQIVAGHSQRYRLSVLQEAFPEIEQGATVQVECLTSEISTNKQFTPLEPHAVQEGVLQATWLVKTLDPTPATGLKVRVGPISAEATLEVLESEEARFAHITSLQFSRKRYTIRSVTTRKRIRILAPVALAGSGSYLRDPVTRDGPNVRCPVSAR